MSETKQWWQMQERGSYLGLKTMVFVYRFLGAGMLSFFVCFVVSFYFIFGRHSRRASQAYLRQLHKFIGVKSPWKRQPSLWVSYKHFMAFGQAVADKITVWFGQYKNEDLDFTGYEVFERAKEKKKGAVIIASHLGNIEICRAIGGKFKGHPLTILVHNAHAVNFQKIMSDVAGEVDNIDILEVSGITPDVAMHLQAKIDAGRYIVIAGDRVAAGSGSRFETLSFLGKPAAFAQGPFLLASLLNCPVMLLFCLKQKQRYHVFFEYVADSLYVPRKKRKEKLRAHMANYVKRLEYYACAYSLQWFNFYDYWQLPTENNSRKTEVEK